ncbi:Mediator of RNA polymerase II transcription subunit 12 [Spathaspora sp. JA1]|nr:Mediator of RNA polymerase II transcription subunit 12 [Spathaspora sp. JA1]
MSKPRNRPSLLSSNRTSYDSTKDELLTMKYQMDKPNLGLYPLSDLNPPESEVTYPDFKPWNDHTHLSGGQQQQEIEKLNNTGLLNKGYFEAPQVTNEYYSARNLIQATVFSSTENCNYILRELSQHLTQAYMTRNEVINKIRYDSNNFRIPPRVTLTATKKEAWLRDLANVNISLVKIGERIPHGIRNKVLVDSLCSRNVPINRALWFTKCVLFSELHALRRKHQTKTTTTIPLENIEKFEIHWLQEWTQQVCDYIHKFSLEMVHIVSLDKKEHYMNKLSYLLGYVQSLYVECLVDKTYFLSVVFKSLKHGLPLQDIERIHNDDKFESDIDVNYGPRLVSLTLMKMFWKDILQTDYLCKELSELLLLNHMFITRDNHENTLPDTLTGKIVEMIRNTVIYLFKYNSNVFIIPKYWIILQHELTKIMMEYSELQSDEDQDEIRNQIDLIKYRNESLILNLKYANANPSNDTSRDTNDILHILNCLDRLKLNQELAGLLKPSITHNSRAVGCTNWRINLRLVLFWCITPYRNHGNSSEGILIICNFLKKHILQNIPNKPEFETEILEIIYQIVDDSIHSKIEKYNLYVLINELYQLKLITIASYLRKLIASGIFFIQPGASHDVNPIMRLHLDILQSLPVLNNRQCDNILKKWLPGGGFNFKEKFHKGQGILQTEIIDKLIANSLTTMDLTYIKSLKVGLKFLLINWITNELKTKLNESTKLIHFDPVVIANLYDFYSCCDNLTVFFKVLVKTILKNEGGMIIFYLDSLYFMSRLIIHHFKLIKSLSGDLPYELFKLIVITYKDLSQREYNFFKFNSIWQFIDGVIEKKYHKEVLDYSHMLDTPMNINTVDIHMSSSSSGERYTSTDFRNDLEVLVNSVDVSLESGEIQETLDNLQLNLDGLSNSESVAALLDYLYKKATTQEHENLIVKLLFSFKVEEPGFVELVKQFVVNTVKSEDVVEAKVKFLKKLVIFEILSINDLYELKALALEVITSETSDLLPNEQLMLNICRETFRDRHLVNFITIISNELDDFAKYKQYVNQALIDNPKLVYESLFMKLSPDQRINVLNLLLDINNIRQLSDFEKIAGDINEFNLPIVQLLLKVISHELINPRDKLQELTNNLVNKCQFKFSPSNSFFGELFNFMSWDQKICILDIIETEFLTKTELNMSDADWLLPFSDFFNKFSLSSTNIVECSSEVFFANLDQFLNKLCQCSNEINNLSIIISIFLRILIIHNVTLCKLLSSGQEIHIQFIKNLLTILNSQLLDEKLHILLYDLLLLMKSSITQELTESELTTVTTSPTSNVVTPEEDKKGGSILSIQQVFEIPEESKGDNPFKLDEQLISCSIMLDEEELNQGGDLHVFNNSGLILKPSRPNETFGSILNQETREEIKFVKFKSFEILEDTSLALNDGCINLQLLDAYTTRENPP